MKKWIGAMLVLALTLCAAGLAEAGLPDAAATVEADAAPERMIFVEADAPYAGRWVNFEDGFRLYLPREWQSYELTDAQAEAGLFYSAGNDSDGTSEDAHMGVAVSYAKSDNLSTLHDLAGDYAAAGFSGILEYDLNGIPAIGFSHPAQDYRGVAFFHPVYSDYVLSVYVTPCGTGSEAATAVGSSILCSLSPALAGK